MPSASPRRLAATIPLLLLAACGVRSGDVEAATGGDEGDRLQLIASFYPLEYVTSRVAGEHADVTTLTRPGLDPHDVELSPREVGALGTADLVVYSSGMQPAVDRAVDTQAQDHSFDVDETADLRAVGESQDDHAGHHDDAGGHHGDHDDAGHDDGDHDDDGEHTHDDHVEDHDGEHTDDDHAGHDHGAEDPHFWLDPERLADVTVAVGEQLAALDPDRAADYEANAASLVADLEELDEEFAEGLAQCESRDLVTTHEAFGYLAERYDLDQTGITGISPESEPSAARLAEITAEVRDRGITAIYAEPLLSDAIARTVAQETGAEVLTLDPADGLTAASAGDDYLAIMRANLAALRDGLGCS